MKSIASIISIFIVGCATSPYGAGFQREYPYEFRPWDYSPDEFNFNVNTIIDTTPYVWFPRKDFPIFYP